MKFNCAWLNEFLEFDVSSKKTIKRLEESGFYVDKNYGEEINTPENFVVGEIIKFQKGAYFIKTFIKDIVTTFYFKSKKDIEIGSKVGIPYTKDIHIQESQLIFAEDIIKCSSKDQLLFFKKNAILGEKISCYVPKNHFLEIEVMQNRPDCLSIYGMAREISRVLDSQSIKTSKHIEALFKILPASCYQFQVLYMSIKKLENNKNIWFRNRLSSSGIELKSTLENIVDYISIELGQIIHIFDKEKILGEIKIRNADNGGEVFNLNGESILLSPEDLVIADGKKVLAVAGIKNNLNHFSIKSDTIVLCTLSVKFSNIKKTIKNLKINKNLFPRSIIEEETSESAILKARYLISYLLGGREESALKYVNLSSNRRAHKIHLSLKQVNRILGLSLTSNKIETFLKKISNNIIKISNQIWEISVPIHRRDMIDEEDIIEEIGKIYGYSNIREKNLDILYKNTKKLNIEEKCSRENKLLMVYRGYHEVINYSFINTEISKFFSESKDVVIINPMIKKTNIMRQSLIPGLISNLQENISRNQTHVKIFEEGLCFKNLGNKKFDEVNKLSGLTFGTLFPVNWKDKTESNYYTIKSDLETLLENMNLKCTFKRCEDRSWLNPEQSSYVIHREKKIGVAGVLSQKILSQLKLSAKSVNVFEISTIFFSKKFDSHIKKISNLPSITRDLSIVVNEYLLSEDIVETLRRSSITFLQETQVIDVYKFPDTNKKSILIRMTFQDDFKTLLDKTINNLVRDIINTLEKKYQAQIRFSEGITM